MAKTLDFKLNIDTDKAESNLDDVEKKIDDIKKDTEKPIDLIISDAKAAQSITDVRKSLKELKTALLGVEVGSESFIKLSQTAGELQERMNEVNDTISSFNQSPIENLSKSFGTLRQKILALDLAGAKTAFMAFGANIKAAAVSMGLLTTGTGVATTAMNVFRVALASTGIGLIIAAVATLISSFDDLANAGGLIGTIFTAIGEAVKFAKDLILDLLDSLGLIDKAALDSKNAQAEYLKNLEEDFAANGDAYDELTQKKKQADIDYLKAVEDINKRYANDELRKNQLIELYNQKRIRAVARAEKDFKDEEERKRKEEYAKQKQLAAEKEAREISFIKDTGSKRLAEIEKQGLKEITKQYELFNQGLIDEQTLIATNDRIRFKTLNERIKIEEGIYEKLKSGVLQNVKETETAREKAIRESEAKITQLRLDQVGVFYTRKKAYEANQEQIDINRARKNATQLEKARQETIIKNQQDFRDEEQKKYNAYEVENKKILEVTTIEGTEFKGIQNELRIRNYEAYIRSLSALDSAYALSVAFNDEEASKQYNDNLKEEKSSYAELMNEKDKLLKNSLDEELKLLRIRSNQEQSENAIRFKKGEISKKEFDDNKLKIETDFNRRSLLLAQDNERQRGILQSEAAAKIEDLNLSILKSDEDLAQARQNVARRTADFQISEAQRTKEEQIRIFNEVSETISTVSNFIANSMNQLSDILSEISARNIQNIDNELNAELAKNQTKLNNGVITQQQFDQAKIDLQKKYNQKKLAEEKKAFEQEKAIRITSAIMTGIQATLAAYSSGSSIPIIGTIMGPVFAAIAAAFSAVQVGLIASEQFPSSGSSGNVSSLTNVSSTSPSSTSANTAAMIPPSFLTNSAGVSGTGAMINPGGIYNPGGFQNTQVWVLESDITGMQGQVGVTEDRSYFGTSNFGG